MSLRRFILMASVDPFRPETRALLARMTTPPSQERAALIDRTIRALIDAGLWTKADVIYFMAAHDAQAARLNWKGATYDASVQSGSPSFSADLGYRNGALATGFTGGGSTNWQLGDAAMSVWADDGADGAFVASATNAVVAPLGDGSSAGLSVVAINQSAAMVITPSDPTPEGLLTGTRFDGDAEVYYNGASLISLTGTENALPSNAVTLLNGSPYRLRFFMAGGGRSAAEESDLYDIVSAYLAGL